MAVAVVGEDERQCRQLCIAISLLKAPGFNSPKHHATLDEFDSALPSC